jgi:hypothetical protein
LRVPLPLVALAAGLALLVAACGGSDDDDGDTDATAGPASDLDFAFIEVAEDEAATVVVVSGSGERRIPLADDLTAVGGLSCRRNGAVALDAARDDRVTRPLVLNGDNFEEVDGIPPGVNPTWVDDETIAWETGSASRDFVIRLFKLDGDALTPPLPGHEPFWLPGIERLAVQGDPAQGFDRIATFGLDLDVARGLRSQARPDGSSPELVELLGVLPLPPGQLHPDGGRFVFVTSAQENAQRDLQIINADGSDPETIVATPEQEDEPHWTADGRIIFLREPLQEAGTDEDTPVEADIIIYDPEAASEEVVGSGTGILSLAACT